jgi:hypothetical protein
MTRSHRPRRRLLRRTVTAAVAALVILGPASAGAQGTAPSPTVTPAAGVPTTGAPLGTLFDLAEVGYAASEFFFEGQASSYHTVDGAPFLADGAWAVEADAAQQPYKVRAQVYRPADPRDFNGTVVVEWLNVTNQSDSAALWILSHVDLAREGAAYVGITAQAIGANAARNLEPGRYGAAGADLVHPGDSFSYDIYSQAGQAIRDNAEVVLQGLVPERLVAIGQSQSATRMVTYINALHPLHEVYDGYFVHSRGASGAPLRQSPLGAISAPAQTLIRTDIDVPVFVVQTETDTRATRQPDTEVFSQWEIAGAAHADMYTLGIGQFDTGHDNSAAIALFDRMLNPTNDPLPGILPPCGLPVNSGPHHWVVQAALHRMDDWLRDGAAPPSAPGLTTTTGAPTGPLALDSDGNVLGGVRSPHVDAPVATIRGSGQPFTSLFCFLFGTTTPFDEERLAALYRNHGTFVSAWNHSVDQAVAGGFVLPADADRLKVSAAVSDVGRRAR